MRAARQLVGSQQRASTIACLLKQGVCLRAAHLGVGQITRAPAEKIGQAKLDGRPGRGIRRTIQERIEGLQRVDAKRGVRVRTVVDDPLGSPRDRVNQPKPPRVTCRNELHQRAEECQRLTVRSAGFGFSDGRSECIDSFCVTNRSRARAVRSRLCGPSVSQ